MGQLLGLSAGVIASIVVWNRVVLPLWATVVLPNLVTVLVALVVLAILAAAFMLLGGCSLHKSYLSSLTTDQPPSAERTRHAKSHLQTP